MLDARFLASSIYCGGFLKPHLWIIKFIGVIVPRSLRADWRQEWESELYYRELLLNEWDRLDWRSKLDLLRRSLGAFRDAMLLQPKRLEDEMFQDLRFGVRMMLKSKGFTAVAVITLALGIGANTAVFTLINALVLRSLPVANPEELVIINASGPARIGMIGMSSQIYHDLRAARQEVFTDIAATDMGGVTRRLSIPANNGIVELDNIQTSSVTANYWRLLGVQPALGRLFTEEEDRNPGSAVVLSYSLWERQFGRDPGVLD